MSSVEKKVVCVTGASGYIASWLVKLLLQYGYTVHATVRDPNDEDKVGHLLKLEGAKERLHIFKADLMEEGSFDSAISGCQGVFHTASPVDFNVIDPQVDVIDPAVKGTLNVLSACKRDSSVRRVVLTSSTAAVLFTGQPLEPDVVVDETWFSKPQYCGKYPSMKWYIISKTLAEEVAWKYAKENDVDLVSINPGMILGPMLQPKLNDSSTVILNLVNGAQVYANVALPWVHLQDVAEAHIRAFELPSANGRYCLVESVRHHAEIVGMLHEIYPSLEFPNKCGDDEPLMKTFKFSKDKAKSLGIQYIPFKKGLKDTVEDLKEKKIIRIPDN
ncbi:phenylacetaldehyde reductase-like [Amaranthus tricolor]|uniref:phenylacetaldehyde reductase-like n=1 Tax=Amaranthus tricolor TaxID=29722 RepID=UPI00258A02C5|nr:phenylacetaldehyde reductase-like [Amaranthus tricolor]